MSKFYSVSSMLSAQILLSVKHAQCIGSGSDSDSDLFMVELFWSLRAQLNNNSSLLITLELKSEPDTFTCRDTLMSKFYWVSNIQSIHVIHFNMLF
jgi:hypothetical protein